MHVVTHSIVGSLIADCPTPAQLTEQLPDSPAGRLELAEERDGFGVELEAVISQSSSTSSAHVPPAWIRVTHLAHLGSGLPSRAKEKSGGTLGRNRVLPLTTRNLKNLYDETERVTRRGPTSARLKPRGRDLGASETPLPNPRGPAKKSPPM